LCVLMRLKKCQSIARAHVDALAPRFGCEQTAIPSTFELIPAGDDEKDGGEGPNHDREEG
jgi:hypothetical protein